MIVRVFFPSNFSTLIKFQLTVLIHFIINANYIQLTLIFLFEFFSTSFFSWASVISESIYSTEASMITKTILRERDVREKIFNQHKCIYVFTYVALVSLVYFIKYKKMYQFSTFNFKKFKLNFLSFLIKKFLIFSMQKKYDIDESQPWLDNLTPFTQVIRISSLNNDVHRNMKI